MRRKRWWRVGKNSPPIQPKGGNYIRRLEALAAAQTFTPGQVYEAVIEHDDWCALLVQGGSCDCDCTVIYRPVTLENDEC